MDYHSIGFRECASEVARYLVAIEGMDLQDPLRVRLMSHLQCYSAQRELSLKSSVHNPWNPSTFPTPLPPAPAPQYPGPSTATVSQVTETPLQPSYSCAEPTRICQSMDNAFGSNNHYSRIPNGPSVNATAMPSTSMALVQPTPPAPPMMAPLPQMSSSNQYLGGHGFSGSGYGTTAPFNQHASSTGRPYRPWGAELAY